MDIDLRNLYTYITDTMIIEPQIEILRSTVEPVIVGKVFDRQKKRL